MLKKLLIAAGLCAAASAPAWSQSGQFPAGTVQGNAGASAGQGSPSSVTSILDRAFSSTRGSILERGASGWAAIGPGATAGLPWVSNAAGADPAYQLLGAVGGGTNNAFFQVSGPASSIKTYTFPNANSTMAALATVQTWTGAQSFTDGDLILLGASSGSVTLHAPATGGASATFFSGTDTVAGLAATQTFTNKTFAASTDVLGGVTMTLGSDATGDMYYRSAGGVLTRLPVCTGSQLVGASGGVPACVSAGTGNVSNTGTPVANQIAQWISSTQIQGANLASLLVAGTGISLSGTTTVTINQSLANATLQANPAGFASITSTTSVMTGAGSTCHLTPVYSGRVRVEFLGIISNNTTLQRTQIQAVFGTGTAPAQGAAGSGTAIDQAKSITSATASSQSSFASGGIITGLAVGTAVWFDLQTLVTADTGTLANMSCTIMEF